MIGALRTLARDAWVVGIGAAAALAYATITLLENAIHVVMTIIDGYPAVKSDGSIEGELTVFDTSFFPWSAEINGHVVTFEALVRSTVLFLVVVPVAALALHATRSEQEAARDD